MFAWQVNLNPIQPFNRLVKDIYLLMDIKLDPLRLNLHAVILVVVITLSACTSSLDKYKAPDIEETISVQSTSISHLSTQVTRQEQTNASQWEVISYLSTQMPYALELITPLPPGAIITRTPCGSDCQGVGPTFTPTPSLSIDIEYPPGMRTGINEIDQVIDVIMDKDLDARLALVRFMTTSCTTVSGLGGPPKCEPDETDGTIVEAFPASSGEGYFVRLKNIGKLFSFTVRGVIAVYVVPEDAYQTVYWPAGEYGIVFTSEEGGIPHTIIVLVQDGFIVRLEFHPGWPPFDLIRNNSDEFILSPIR